MLGLFECRRETKAQKVAVKTCGSSVVLPPQPRRGLTQRRDRTDNDHEFVRQTVTRWGVFDVTQLTIRDYI